MLVDLAGSERVSRSGAVAPCADPRQLREACSINKSLSCLVDVFAALGAKKKPPDALNATTRDRRARQQQHVPYRNSKLTHMLQNALSGDGKALLIATLSADEKALDETLCTLRFAAQVAQLEGGKPTKKCLRRPRNSKGDAAARKGQ